MQTNNRKKFLICPQFQLTMLIINAALFIVNSLIIVGLFYFSHLKLKELGASANLGETHPFFNFLELNFFHTLKYVIVGVAITLLLSSISILVVSHKISGPIVRLISYLKGIQDTRKVGPLQFRKNDYFTDLPQSLLGAFKSLGHYEGPTDPK